MRRAPPDALFGAPSSSSHSTHVERVQLGGVNPTYRVSSSSPLTVHAPVHTPVHSGGDVFLKAACREHIAREVKAIAIARLMGLDRYVHDVWLARLSPDDGGRTYLASRWLDGRAPTDADECAGWLRDGLPAGDKTALLLHQYVVGDYDRHIGNWFRQRSPAADDGHHRLIALDWGCAFGWSVTLPEDADESALLVYGWDGPSDRWRAPLWPALLRHVAHNAGRIQQIASAGIGTRYAASLATRLGVVSELARHAAHGGVVRLDMLAAYAARAADREGLTQRPATTGMERYAHEMQAYGYSGMGAG